MHVTLLLIFITHFDDVENMRLRLIRRRGECKVKRDWMEDESSRLRVAFKGLV